MRVPPAHLSRWYSNTPLPSAAWKLMSLPPRPRAPRRRGLPCTCAPHRAGGHPGRTAGTEKACANRQKGQCQSFLSHLSLHGPPPPHVWGEARTGGPSAHGWQQITPGETQHSSSTPLNFTLCFETEHGEIQQICHFLELDFIYVILSNICILVPESRD